MQAPAHDLLTIRTMLQAALVNSANKYLGGEFTLFEAYMHMRNIANEAVKLLEAEERA
jgi:hypothetical protein